MGNTSRSLQQTIVVFTVLIFVFFVTITVLSGVQYSRYKIVDGTAICEEFVNKCLLSFPYQDQNGLVRTKVSPIAFHEINQSGVFNVKVAYRPPPPTSSSTPSLEPSDFFVIGSPYHTFLGTKSLFLIYLTLSFLAFLICLSFLPWSTPPASPAVSVQKR